ncbi:MAG: hypothetical protein JWR61_5013 [Ferruginibacter sp.]|uniref:choice-of-anchor tandem repeat GloVer-containing protein n=1 Tax=Ferruginibacter sp. TaxID=1940288 RepID=UPI0026580F5A|nr:choice-of-anchor tandem repeat GloVer-containing protein [Ferruginibacter sp.]MDB5280058.1 hypothetical protein [Ferruginibacter sp.]
MKKIILSISYFIAGVFLVKAQVLYGTTARGGNEGAGAIIKFTPSANSLMPIHSFSYNNTDSGFSETGITPSGKLVRAKDGKLYGMTETGGRNNRGVIYSFDLKTFATTRLVDFGKDEGMYTEGTGGKPQGSLFEANDGKLYGMAMGGGHYGAGVIFSFNPADTAYQILMRFTDFYTVVPNSLHTIVNGGNPAGSLMQATNGKLYGMNQTGGQYNYYGVLFEFDLLTATFKKLVDFDYTNGSRPLGNLVQASDGKLYGLTINGGIYGNGVIFAYDPPSSKYTKLKDFNDAEGSYPFGSLIKAKDGKLYGTTSKGGDYGSGVIFNFDPLSSRYEKIVSFTGLDGAFPGGDFMEGSDGKLYGMTSLGGIRDSGVVFSFDPATSSFKKIADFNGNNGANPGMGSAFIEVNECTADNIYYRDADNDGYGNLNDSIKACSQPADYVKNNTDCNDNNPAIHSPVTYFRDADSDGFGDASHPISVCESIPPAGYVTNNYDCEDNKRPGNGRDEMVAMCHNGKEQCTKVKEINKKLQQGWTLGPCNNASGTGNDNLVAKNHSFKGGYKFINYPNPFTSTCTIQYELPFDSKISIKVYDVLGRPVAVLVNDNKKAGVYTIDINAGNLNKGLLLLKIIATSNEQQFEQTNKLVLMK